MNDGTVDGTHPTDLGFWSMAKVLGDFIESNKENIGFVFEDQEIYNKLKDLINKKCCRMIKTTSIIQN